MIFTPHYIMVKAKPVADDAHPSPSITGFTRDEYKRTL